MGEDLHEHSWQMSEIKPQKPVLWKSFSLAQQLFTSISSVQLHHSRDLLSSFKPCNSSHMFCFHCCSNYSENTKPKQSMSSTLFKATGPVFTVKTLILSSPQICNKEVSSWKLQGYEYSITAKLDYHECFKLIKKATKAQQEKRETRQFLSTQGHKRGV